MASNDVHLHYLYTHLYPRSFALLFRFWIHLLHPRSVGIVLSSTAIHRCRPFSRFLFGWGVCHSLFVFRSLFRNHSSVPFLSFFFTNFFSSSSGIPHRVWISGTLFCICTARIPCAVSIFRSRTYIYIFTNFHSCSLLPL
ncbi:hypothetical protein BJ912DRAFT_979884, partial [Pholiota molesta]